MMRPRTRQALAILATAAALCGAWTWAARRPGMTAEFAEYNQAANRIRIEGYLARPSAPAHVLVGSSLSGRLLPSYFEGTRMADVATLGSRTLNRTEEGVDYSVKLKAQRIGAFADWFVLGGGFRVSGGVTSNDYKLSMSAKSTTNISIGSNTYSGTSLAVTVKFPSATPYLGIGYGHHGGKGLGFVWDLGASIGKAKVTANAVGFPDNAQFNADLDRELEQLRSGVGKIRILPQASIALSYKF